MKKNTHVTLTIGCPKLGCAGFSVEAGKHICDCGKDITKEFERIAKAIEQSLKLSNE